MADHHWLLIEFLPPLWHSSRFERRTIADHLRLLLVVTKPVGFVLSGLVARVAELVDALVLGTSGETRGSSSLPFRTSISGLGYSSCARFAKNDQVARKPTMVTNQH